ATSQDDPTVTATAVVSIVAPTTVTVQPAEVTLSAGGQQQFMALDSKGQPIGSVTWLITNLQSGGGAIDGKTGLYSAPPAGTSPIDVHIAAVAQTGDQGEAVIHLITARSVGLLSGPEIRYLPNDARSVDVFWKTDVSADSTVELGTAAGVYPNKFTLPA